MKEKFKQKLHLSPHIWLVVMIRDIKTTNQMAWKWAEIWSFCLNFFLSKRECTLVKYFQQFLQIDWQRGASEAKITKYLWFSHLEAKNSKKVYFSIRKIWRILESKPILKMLTFGHWQFLSWPMFWSKHINFKKRTSNVIYH